MTWNGQANGDTGWVAIPALTGFTSAAEVRIKHDLVKFRGTFGVTGAGNFTASSNADVGTVPAGFRPPQTVAFQVRGGSSASSHRMVIAATGVITINTSATATSVAGADVVNYYLD